MIINPFPEEVQLENYKKAVMPYTFEVNCPTLVQQARILWQDVSDIRAEFCPDNFAQASLTLHPAFADQEHFPDQLLQHCGLFCLGTRKVKVYPRFSLATTGPTEELGISIIVLSKRQNYQALAYRLEEIKEGSLLAYQVMSIESIEAITSYDRLAVPNDYYSNIYLVGVYIRPGETAQETKTAFTNYALKNEFIVNDEFFIEKGGIFYLLIKGARYNLDSIAEHPLVSIIEEPPLIKKEEAKENDAEEEKAEEKAEPKSEEKPADKPEEKNEGKPSDKSDTKAEIAQSIEDIVELMK